MPGRWRRKPAASRRDHCGAQRREGGLSRYAREGAEVAGPQATHLAQMAVQEGCHRFFSRAAALRARTGAIAAADACAVPAPTPSTTPDALPIDDSAGEPLSRGKKILKLAKTLLIAASVAIIVVGIAQTAMEYLFSDTPAGMPSKDQSQSPAITEPEIAPSTRPSRPMSAPEGSLPAPRATDPDDDQLDQPQFVVL